MFGLIGNAIDSRLILQMRIGGEHKELDPGEARTQGLICSLVLI